MLEGDAKMLVYSINELLLPIDSGFLAEFKQEYLPMFVNLPFGSLVWLEDGDELNRLIESVFKQQEQRLNDLAAIVGNENLKYLQERSELEEYARSLGIPQREIDEIIASITEKSATMVEMKNELYQAVTKLADIKNRAREKFAPKEEDGPDILWGKLLRFMSLYMYDEAVECAQMFQLKMQGRSPEANIYVPAAIRFIRQVSSTGVDYGVLVCGYEPEKPRHSVYEIGDVIVAVNDAICINYNQLVEKIPDDSEYKVTVLRADAEGKLQFMELLVPAGEPNVLLLDMTEQE